MTLHGSYYVSSAGKLVAYPEDQIDDDPRGLVLMWEPPLAGARYYLGCDPTVGIVDWSREFRSENDNLTDNACIQVIRRGKPGPKDKQVLILEKAAEANRLAAIMQGNNTATKDQRSSTLEAIRSSASANSSRNDTPAGHLNASNANATAAEQWKNIAENEHSPQYKDTYARLIKKHVDLAQQHKSIYFERLAHSKKTKKSTLDKLFEIGKLLDDNKPEVAAHEHGNRYPDAGDGFGPYWINEHGRRIYGETA